ncbi:MAG: hypothetical protein J0M26_24325 [Planctomycetes bacterium]|nr:hypothetical protein [Planctomycetota bacterium]MBN8604163.1 hypothetical protein [Planctomycetota bacterium]
MELPLIIDGRLHTGHCIYFRRDPPLSDQQILAHFGLRNYLRADSLPKTCTYAVLADIGDWVLLADDLLYRLWNTPTTALAVESLAESRDVFTWSVGDCDMSFGYRIFKNGELIRDYAVDSPHFVDQLVRTDFGVAMTSELELLVSDLQIELKVGGIGELLGINPFVSREMLRLYYKPWKSELDPSAGIRNF